MKIALTPSVGVRFWDGACLGSLMTASRQRCTGPG